MPRCPRRSVVLALILAVGSSSLGLAARHAAVSGSEQVSFTGKVTRILDGDTIEVLRDVFPVRIRLHGIDCPERRQPFGTRARECTGDLAFGKAITVRVRDVDRYSWIVGEVILPGGRNLNHELVKAGLAWWYKKYAPEDETLRKLEAEARSAKRGLWRGANPIPPWVWRQLQRVR